jgi:PadR family transcriptional regulator, regulatory protein PadR
MKVYANDLTRLEEIFLLTIWRLKDNAYGVSIQNMISSQIRKNISDGAIYFTLNQIYRKGLVSRHIGNPTPVRGGARKKYYNITPKGFQALKESLEIQKILWGGISDKMLDDISIFNSSTH